MSRSEELATNFESLRLAKPLLRAVAAEGYGRPTEIQAQSIPHVMEGRDLLGCAQTGTGKTAAFALPLLHRLAHREGQGRQRRIRCLVLCPTRELAVQISDSFQVYGRHTGLRNTTIYGGVSQNIQARALRQGVDIVVATPGRLLDLMGQGLVNLHWVEALVLDEADRMLDMGFIHDIRKIVAQVPNQRQTLLFSATMPAAIEQLAATILQQPVQVRVASQSTAAETVEQSVYYVDQKSKPVLLGRLLNNTPMTRALVFTRTKHGADKVVRQLHMAGIRAEAIHGNKSQAARQRVLGRFRANQLPVLVATDIAARGIDVDGISHVINYDVPHEPETYVHRIGRTGRAGASGIAVSFCLQDERRQWKAIERLVRQDIRVRQELLEETAGVVLPTTAATAQPIESPAPPRRRATGSAGRTFEGRSRGPQTGRGRKPLARGSRPPRKNRIG